MKKVIYEMVVDLWRMASKYQFQKLTDDEWKQFVKMGEGMLEKYKQKGSSVERLFRDIYSAFQGFYERIGKEGQKDGK